MIPRKKIINFGLFIPDKRCRQCQDKSKDEIALENAHEKWSNMKLLMTAAAMPGGMDLSKLMGGTEGMPDLSKMMGGGAMPEGLDLSKMSSGGMPDISQLVGGSDKGSDGGGGMGMMFPILQQYLATTNPNIELNEEEMKEKPHLTIGAILAGALEDNPSIEGTILNLKNEKLFDDSVDQLIVSCGMEMLGTLFKPIINQMPIDKKQEYVDDIIDFLGIKPEEVELEPEIRDPFAQDQRTRHYHSGLLRAQRLAQTNYKPPPNTLNTTQSDVEESRHLRTVFQAIKLNKTETLSFDNFDLPKAYFKKYRELINILTRNVKEISKTYKGPEVFGPFNTPEKLEIGDGKITTLDRAKRLVELLKYKTERDATSISNFTQKPLVGSAKSFLSEVAEELFKSIIVKKVDHLSTWADTYIEEAVVVDAHIMNNVHLQLNNKTESYDRVAEDEFEKLRNDFIKQTKQYSELLNRSKFKTPFAALDKWRDIKVDSEGKPFDNEYVAPGVNQWKIFGGTDNKECDLLEPAMSPLNTFPKLLSRSKDDYVKRHGIFLLNIYNHFVNTPNIINCNLKCTSEMMNPIIGLTQYNNKILKSLPRSGNSVERDYLQCASWPIHVPIKEPVSHEYKELQYKIKEWAEQFNTELAVLGSKEYNRAYEKLATNIHDLRTKASRTKKEDDLLQQYETHLKKLTANAPSKLSKGINFHLYNNDEYLESFSGIHSLYSSPSPFTSDVLCDGGNKFHSELSGKIESIESILPSEGLGHESAGPLMDILVSFVEQVKEIPSSNSDRYKAACDIIRVYFRMICVVFIGLSIFGIRMENERFPFAGIFPSLKPSNLSNLTHFNISMLFSDLGNAIFNTWMLLDSFSSTDVYLMRSVDQIMKLFEGMVNTKINAKNIKMDSLLFKWRHNINSYHGFHMDTEKQSDKNNINKPNMLPAMDMLDEWRNYQIFKETMKEPFDHDEKIRFRHVPSNYRKFRVQCPLKLRFNNRPTYGLISNFIHSGGDKRKFALYQKDTFMTEQKLSKEFKDGIDAGISDFLWPEPNQTLSYLKFMKNQTHEKKESEKEERELEEITTVDKEESDHQNNLETSHRENSDESSDDTSESEEDGEMKFVEEVAEKQADDVLESVMDGVEKEFAELRLNLKKYKRK